MTTACPTTIIIKSRKVLGSLCLSSSLAIHKGLVLGLVLWCFNYYHLLEEEFVVGLFVQDTRVKEWRLGEGILLFE